MGSQRIASELMGAPFDADDLADNPLEGPGGMEKTQGGSSYPGSGAMGALSAWASFDTLLQRLDITTEPDFWDGLVTLIHYQEYFLESQYNDLAEGCVPGEAQQGPNKTQTPNPTNKPDPECLCANSPFYAWEIHGIECTEYRLLYWYHPDYLGHNEFITDMAGLPYQYFHYSAFGETLVEDNAHYGQFSSPYRFNAKELDQEPSRASSRTPLKNKTWGEQTGNYYYGARYYNPTWSVWLGVDPLAGVYPHATPYNFVENNPINLIDPTGLGPEEPTMLDEVTVTAKAPNWLSRTWFKVKQFFKGNEFTASVDLNINIGIQAGLNTPIGRAKLNASSIELFSGGVDLTKREGYIDNSIADDGVVVAQEASMVVKLPVKLRGEGRNFSVSARAGQTQRITDNNGWLENGGFSSSGYETYGDVSILVPVVRTSNPALTRVNQDPVSVSTSAKATAGSNFIGLDVGAGATFILGVNVNIKVGFNAKR